MHKKLLGLAVAMTALTSLFTAAQAQETKTIGVSIPAADHGWTAGVVYHANRVAAEQALRESEARFRAITNSIEQMIWSTRPDAAVLPAGVERS